MNINNMTLLEKAIQLAVYAHRGQVDKSGQPYILHPLRIMLSVDTTEEKIVAVLHDVVEDTSFTIEDLVSEGIPDICVQAIELLTHDKAIPYMNYIEQIATNPLSTKVKLADLRDNSDISRLKEITDTDKERLKKYRIAIAYLDNINSD
jgi:(p)ppGpp synthase/HD superfamily hydrolase